MPPKPKKNKDDFEIPNKHRIKLEKIDRKDQLRHVQAPISRRVLSLATLSNHLRIQMMKNTTKNCKF